MARVFGLEVQQTALYVASVLANATGPTSGVATRGGRSISKGINLIGVGEVTARAQRLTDYFLQPLLGMQDYLRDAASRCSKSLMDAHTFGPGKLQDWQAPRRRNELFSRVGSMEKVITQDLAGGDGLPFGWDRNDPYSIGSTELQGHTEEGILRSRTPNFRHCPSFVLCPRDFSQILRMMAEVAEQHCFIIDNDGELFRNRRTGKGKTAAIDYLANAIGGKDMDFDPIHSDQGYGRLRRTQVRLWSWLTLKKLGDMLADEDAPERDILEHSILCVPHWHGLSLLAEGLAESAKSRYQAALERIVNDRALRAGTVVPLYEGAQREFELLDIEMVSAVDRYPASLQRHLWPFATLPFQLFWAFSLLKTDEHEQWPLLAAKTTALHALEGHVAIIEKALDEQRIRKLEGDANRVFSILRKEPCSARDVQRSMYGSKRGDVAAALEYLISNRRVAYSSDTRRYEIMRDGVDASMGRGAYGGTING